MSLDVYRHARIIVQNARTSVLEAARAMSTNEVGCVVVVQDERVVGLVTDRDIVVRAVSEGRDPAATALRDVMSPSVATLRPDAVAADALELMRRRGLRRVPLVDGDRVVGMVTLDDLLLDEAAPLADIARVVQAQLVEGGPARTRRFDEWASFQRRYARAHATQTKLVVDAQKAARLRTREHAEKALWTVVLALVRRLTTAQATKVIPQLPALLRNRLADVPPGPDPSMSRERIDAEIARELDVDAARAAQITAAVGRALARNRPLASNLRRYLPLELRSIVRAAAPVPVPRRELT
jgi:predicted transcriptional regulator/uncharacterized protein (DUF2267 family)